MLLADWVVLQRKLEGLEIRREQEGYNRFREELWKSMVVLGERVTGSPSGIRLESYES